MSVIASGSELSSINTDNPNHPERSLGSCVNLLGRLLGEVILDSHGELGFNIIENLRKTAKQSRENQQKFDRQKLRNQIEDLNTPQSLLVARAFTQFLNLANIAEQFYESSQPEKKSGEATDLIRDKISQFIKDGINNQKLVGEIRNLNLDLVLTAHPTEITRRTIIEKHNKIYDCLFELETRKLSKTEKQQLIERLKDLIAQWWHTDEIRARKPTPVDEAVWGFAVIENSLWEAIPQFINNLTSALESHCKEKFPIDYCPIHFTSWMGGDRDGNPNVTSTVTQEVIWLARWKSADLFLQDVQSLISELSMNQCNNKLKQLAGGQREPYRAVLKNVRSQLQNTLQYMDDLLKGRDPTADPILESTEQLWSPLHDCYISLCESGMQIIANGKLRDTLHRIQCFGIYLLQLDIRQESGRHAKVFEELTVELYGTEDANNHYSNWNETQRCEFLTSEIKNRRPLLPRNWHPSEEVSEVLRTFTMLSNQPSEALGAYVISMAKAPSDVLAVQLLLKESGCAEIPIAPLFETLDDLNNAPEVLTSLLSNPTYFDSINNKQMVMIGYSDSSKDAGVMAASWAQYQAQEALQEVCEKANVQLTLFHGRGGTTGRGGAPAQAALLSQPPGTLKNGLRVTEQGEMIRFKLGMPQKAVNTLELYTTAILQSNLTPPPEPLENWRKIMDQLSSVSAQAYRQKVFQQADFLDYFKEATPISELSTLPLGSRPARRKSKKDGVESLRAIPWSFSWSQNRLMFPAWFGAGQALQKLADDGHNADLEAMCKQWPFFSTRISLLEMVFAKTDSDISSYYEQKLASINLHNLGQELRTQLTHDIALVLSISNDTSLLEDLPALVDSLSLRNTYIDTLNLLQVELLARSRTLDSVSPSQASSPGNESEMDKALMVTVAGIAAGLRNTG